MSKELSFAQIDEIMGIQYLFTVDEFKTIIRDTKPFLK